mgnify:CR=1 FL=1
MTTTPAQTDPATAAFAPFVEEAIALAARWSAAASAGETKREAQSTGQLAALLFLTGGLENPFSVLLIVPVIISAATLPARYTAALGLVVFVSASVLVFSHLPLPWYADVPLDIPFIFVAGMWAAVLSSVAFTAFYVYRVADEARSLADALSATELVLQREHHLSALDGLAAAAAHELGTPLATISLVSKEMDRATAEEDPLKEDVRLLRAQADLSCSTCPIDTPEAAPQGAARTVSTSPSSMRAMRTRSPTAKVSPSHWGRALQISP